MRYRPVFSKWTLRRRQKRGPSKNDLDSLGEEIDNIFKFQDHERK